MKGEKGLPHLRSPNVGGSTTRPPAVSVQKGAKGSPVVTKSTEEFDFELDEKHQQRSFRRITVWALPIVAFGWLVLIAWATLERKIPGIQVGIVLGITGAGLLTLLGFPIAWAYSHKKPADAHPATAILESLRKLLNR